MQLDVISKMISYSHDLCFIIKDSIIVGCNNVARYTDYYDKDIIGKNITDIFDKKYREFIEQAVLKGKERCNIMAVLDDGNEYSFNIARWEEYIVLLGENTHINIHAEETKRQLCIAVNGMSEGVLILSKTNNIVFANTAICKLLNVENYKELLDLKLENLFDEKSNNILESSGLPKLHEKGQWEKKLVCKLSGGKTIPVHVSFTLVKGNGYICLLKDLSEQEKIKKERKKQFADELAKVVGFPVIDAIA